MAQESRASRFERNKKDPYEGFNFSINGFAGIMTAQAPDLIPDNAAQIITNFVPTAGGTLRKVRSPATVATYSANIVKYFNGFISSTNSVVSFVVLADGSAYSGTTQIAPAGTFSTTEQLIDITSWESEAFLIIDSSKGYFVYQPNYTPPTTAWAASTAYSQYSIIENGSYYYIQLAASGTSGTSAPAFPTTPGSMVSDNTCLWQCMAWSNNLWTVSTSIMGQSICAWRGRVFIGSNARTLNYSAPLSYFDFTSTNGGGSEEITSSNLTQQIVKIIPYMDSLYIIGDHDITALTGSTITNDPSQWYNIEIFTTLGASINRDSIVNYNNVIYLINEYGIYEIASTQTEKIDYPIDITKTVPISTAHADIAQIENLNYYLIPATGNTGITDNQNFILAYCIDTKTFYYLDFGGINGVFTTRTLEDHSIYAWGGATLYRLFDGTDALTSVILTKMYDFGVQTLYKTVKSVTINSFIYSGVPSITCTIQSQLANMIASNSSNGLKVVTEQVPGISTDSGVYGISTSTYTSGPLFLNISTATAGIHPIVFIFRSGGITSQFKFVDTSSAQFDIASFSMVGWIDYSYV